MQISYSSSLNSSEHSLILTDKLDFILGWLELGTNEKYVSGKLNKKKDMVFSLPIDDTIIIFAILNSPAKNKDQERENSRRLAAKAYAKLEGEDIASINLLSSFGNDVTAPFVEGLLLSSYSFDKYKTKKKVTDKTVNIVLSGIINESIKPQVKELEVLSESNAVGRTLVNEPVSFLTATQLSNEILRLSKEYGFEFKCLEKKQIESLKMGGLLAVNKGSIEPPTFNVLEWKPENSKNSNPVVLVGKGVVYDTGGYDLKTGGHMNNMKMDMGGAAAVVGTLCAVSRNKLPIHVIGLIPSTDNRIGPDGLVADDVITMYDGTTVEVKNTDAEGRLILADALAYAQKYNPELVIDLATLTGAAMRVTGCYGSAMMGNADDDTKQALTNAGEYVHERLIEFPFWEEFDDEIKSTIADIKNLGGPAGGATTAGKFLEHFTNYPWIHLDIAGPAFLEKPYLYFKEGGTGVGIRILYQFLSKK